MPLRDIADELTRIAREITAKPFDWIRKYNVGVGPDDVHYSIEAQKRVMAEDDITREVGKEERNLQQLARKLQRLVGREPKIEVTVNKWELGDETSHSLGISFRLPREQYTALDIDELVEKAGFKYKNRGWD